MGYYIDLKTITTETYKAKLKDGYVLPSRMILKENIDKRFDYFMKNGIKNLFDLQQALKKKKSYEEFQKNEIFSEEYLDILLREINSLQPKPSKIKDFPGISKDITDKLESKNIKDTLQLYDWIKTRVRRKELSNATGISEENIIELTKLCDLSRIRWVGATFARALYEAGYDTSEKVANANYEELHANLLKLNKEKNIYKGNIGQNDMKLCVLIAKDIPTDIEY